MFCARAAELETMAATSVQRREIIGLLLTTKSLRCHGSGLRGARQPGHLRPRLFHLGERRELRFGDARQDRSGFPDVLLVAQRLEELGRALHEARGGARGLAV